MLVQCKVTLPSGKHIFSRIFIVLRNPCYTKLRYLLGKGHMVSAKGKTLPVSSLALECVCSLPARTSGRSDGPGVRRCRCKATSPHFQMQYSWVSRCSLHFLGGIRTCRVHRWGQLQDHLVSWNLKVLCRGGSDLRGKAAIGLSILTSDTEEHSV